MTSNTQDQYQFDDLTVDTGKRLVLRDTSALEISGLTYDLLLAMVQAAPNIISADELVEKVWSGRPTSPETITQRAMMLRQALGDSAEAPRYFEVVRGQGFRLIPSVGKASDPDEIIERPKLPKNRVATVAAVVALIVVAWLGKDLLDLGSTTQSEAAAPVRRFSIELGELSKMGAGVGSIRTEIALSPDGSRFVYVGRASNTENTTRLYIRELNRLEAQVISGTDGARRPFFSPDGEWIGYDGSAGTELSKVSIRGGVKKTLTEGHRRTYGATWSEDGTIVFSTTSGTSNQSGKLVKVSANGGAPEDLLVSDGNQAFTWPNFLPGGGHLLFSSRNFRAPSTEGGIEILSLESGQRRTLIAGAFNAKYSPTGHIVYARGDALWAVPFDLDSMQVTGVEAPLLDSVEYNSLIGDAIYDFSDDGLLVYLLGDEANIVNPEQRVPVWIDREGDQELIDVPPADYGDPNISPDGSQAVMMVAGETGLDIWTVDLQRESSSRLTFGPEYDVAPHWSPDGERIIYSSGNNGPGIFSMAANGTGSPELINKNSVANSLIAISHDGKQLVVLDNWQNESDMYVLSVDGESFPQPFITTEFDEDRSEISPDGDFIAYESNETGRDEIYVRTFPNPDEGRWQISVDGGVDPRWNPGGNELFFRGPGSAAIFAVDVQVTPTFSAGVPRFVVAGEDNPGNNSYDVSANGQRFLMYRRLDDGTEAEVDGDNNARLAIVENWFEELKRITPSDTSE